MTWTVQLDPPAVAGTRSMLDLSPVPGNSIQVDTNGIDWGEASITTYEANEQRWGSSVISYRVPNRMVTIPLFLGADAASSAETARAALQQKVALFQRRGGWLLRQRPGATPLYADVVNASLVMPDRWMELGGVEPNVSLILECLPDFYGDSISLDTITATGETQAVLQQAGQQAVIKGDHAARTTVTVTDSSGNPQLGCLWGFRSYYYSSAATAQLAYSAASSWATAHGSSVSALSGGRNGQVITSAGLSATPTTFATYTASHIGSYQVWARVYSSAANNTVGLGWALGDTSNVITNQAVTIPGPSAFYLVNLGQVRIDPAPIGAQQWVAQIQAAGSGQVSVDMVYFQPLEDNAGSLAGSASNPVISGSGRLQMRYDSVYRSIAGGSVFTPVPQVVGDLPRMPPSGAENLPMQFLFKPSRGNLGSYPDGGTDSFSVAISYRPCWLFRP